MNVVTKKTNNGLMLIDETSGYPVFFSYKHTSINAYIIVDFRYTDKFLKLEDFFDLCGDGKYFSTTYENYLKYKDLFDFLFDTYEVNGKKFVKWHDLNGIVLGGDKKENGERYDTECFQWSYREMRKKLKEAKEYWKNLDTNVESVLKNSYNNQRLKDTDLYGR